MSVLVDKIVELMLYHTKKGESPERSFNRQLHERVLGKRLPAPKEGWAQVRLADDDVQVVEEQWSLEQLALLGGWHGRDSPKQEGDPVIVFRGWNCQCLIDGQTRLNKWLRCKNAGPHRVLVVEPQRGVANPFPSSP